MKKISFLILTALLLGGCSLTSWIDKAEDEECVNNTECRIGQEQFQTTENNGPVTVSELESELNQLDAVDSSAGVDDFNDAGLSNAELGL